MPFRLCPAWRVPRLARRMGGARSLLAGFVALLAAATLLGFLGFASFAAFQRYARSVRTPSGARGHSDERQLRSLTSLELLSIGEGGSFQRLTLVTPPAAYGQVTGELNSTNVAPPPPRNVYAGDSRYVTLTVFAAELCAPNSTYCRKRTTSPAATHHLEGKVALLLFAEDDTSDVAATKESIRRWGSGVFGASSRAAVEHLRLQCAWSDGSVGHGVVDVSPVGEDWASYFFKVYCDIPPNLLTATMHRPTVRVCVCVCVMSMSLETASLETTAVAAAADERHAGATGPPPAARAHHTATAWHHDAYRHTPSRTRHLHAALQPHPLV